MVGVTGLSGRIALVTGAARGIGAAIAEALVHEGVSVAGVDIDVDGLKAVADRTGGSVVPFPVDVTDQESFARVVEEVERDLGPLDIGVSAAGVLLPASVGSTRTGDWVRTFEVNSTGVFFVLREISHRMVPRGRGVLITIGSNAAGVPRTGMAAYAASKAAATMLTRCLGLELAGSGVRCNIVSPGSTDTEMQRALWTEGNGPERVIAGDPAQFRVGIPLKRIAAPADVADAVVFLVSDRARHITMQNLYVDGGATLCA
ncbi:2,3-dihydro-2,3-dihydroxybenzoate dehydrogenase [Actinokineospora globicatena]|nr:2,3-dihydro-2,3-dihydroxybenzoate dehydrogenase [Actinokineospora globicatena]